jgi:hypothetical protein
MRREGGPGHLVISAIPVSDPTHAPPAGYETKGHFVILTRRGK